MIRLFTPAESISFKVQIFKVNKKNSLWAYKKKTKMHYGMFRRENRLFLHVFQMFTREWLTKCVVKF